MESLFLYLGILTVTPIISILRNNGIKKKIYLFFSLLVLTLFVGLRYEVGTDYSTYIYIYDGFDVNNVLDLLSRKNRNRI